jgi:hypothetical protein
MHDMGIKGEVKIAGKNFMDTIKWSDVKMDEDAYVLRCFAANILPTQPAGRLQKVQELVQAGWLDKAQGKKLIDFPDLESEMQKDLSSTDLTNKMIDQILEDGTWVSPEPEMDLNEALSVSQKRLIEAQLNKYPEANIELLTRWREAAKSMLPAPEPQPVVGGAPQANPMSTPQSDLIPNVPQ